MHKNMYITTYRTVSYAIPHNYLSKTKHINGGKGAIVKKNTLMKGT